MPLDSSLLDTAIPRLESEDNIWIATVRPDGKPHLVPIWFIWLDSKVWICTPINSQKVKNIQRNPGVIISLEDGVNPVIFEGIAALRQDARWVAELAPHFKEKYDWDFRTDDTANYVLVEIEPVRMISWT